MRDETRTLLHALRDGKRLSEDEFASLVQDAGEDSTAYAASLAVAARESIYGHRVFARGLLEISNHCRNNCLYCGIRRGNVRVQRYRLDADDIFARCELGYTLGFRTFVLQGGEDPLATDEWLCRMVARVRKNWPDCAITLSLGERSRASYQVLFDAGANRYLLRHETADAVHYRKLHPPEMSWEHRMDCLKTLKAIGFQTGCGFMVGSPHQTARHLAKDLFFVQKFQPEMCGIGPFVPQHDTPFRNQPPGNLRLTLYLLSLLRLIRPSLLLPATTALSALHPQGRELGLMAGANVVMPNLSPPAVRGNYALYDNKPDSGAEAAEGRAELAHRLAVIGYELVGDRGDPARQ